MINFNEITNRRGSGSVKWDEAPSQEVIPLWVADMDFQAAPAIRRALQERLDHGVFGYTYVDDTYYDAVISWFQRRHQWTIHREEIIYVPGVVPALSATLQALTMHGERVLMLSPAYNCFFSSIRNSGCEVRESVLKRTVDGGFEVDWDDFEVKCCDEKTTVYLLCNPHNPTGRVWTKEELQRMNDICMKHGVIVVSDEIHCELVMPGYRFQPFAAVSEACKANSVVMNAPTKAFNIAGLQIANIICSNAQWRRRIDRAVNINEVCDVNVFAPVALKAAYNESEAWLNELIVYLWDNYLMLKEMASEHLPQWQMSKLEGTYLPWIDITATGMSSEQYADYLMQKAGVWVNPGTMYGEVSGAGFIRMNIACRRSLLREALERIIRQT